MMLKAMNTSRKALPFRVQGLPKPQITYLFKDLCTEIILGNLKKQGFTGPRQGFTQMFGAGYPGNADPASSPVAEIWTY